MRRPARACWAITIPPAWGGARPRLSELRARDRGDRAGQRHGRRRRSSSRTTRSSPNVVAPVGAPQTASAGCGSWRRGAAIGAFALSEPDAGTDAANQQTARGRDGRRLSAITGARSGSPTRKPPSSRSSSPARSPALRGQGVTAFLVPIDRPGITQTARADSLGVRGLGCMDLDPRRRARGDDDVLGPVDQGFRSRDVGARRAAASAIAAQALGIGEAALARSHRARASSARPSASRSPTTRRFSGCSPTWPPSSKRRGC